MTPITCYPMVGIDAETPYLKRFKVQNCFKWTAMDGFHSALGVGFALTKGNHSCLATY